MAKSKGSFKGNTSGFVKQQSPTLKRKKGSVPPIKGNVKRDRLGGRAK